MSQTLTAPIPDELADYLDNLNHHVKPKLMAQGYMATPINAREALANITHTLVTNAPTMQKVMDCQCILPKNSRQFSPPLRIFVPKNQPLPNIEKPVAVPVMIFFHGGGGMAGSVSVYDKIYKKMAEAANCVVVAPEYRLAPENRYPAGIEDAHTVLQSLSDTLKSVGYECQNNRCCVAGDSAGGAMVATLVQDWLAHKIDGDCVIDKQILIYAGLDYTLSQPSVLKNATGYLLETEKIRWYYQHYFNVFDDRALASPFWTDLQILAKYTTYPLPKTLHITAGYCPLRDEGIGYHQQMLQAGFDSHWRHFPEMIHTFMNMENICQQACQRLYAEIAQFMG